MRLLTKAALSAAISKDLSIRIKQFGRRNSHFLLYSTLRPENGGVRNITPTRRLSADGYCTGCNFEARGAYSPLKPEMSIGTENPTFTRSIITIVLNPLMS